MIQLFSRNWATKNYSYMELSGSFFWRVRIAIGLLHVWNTACNFDQVFLRSSLLYWSIELQWGGDHRKYRVSISALKSATSLTCESCLLFWFKCHTGLYQFWYLLKKMFLISFYILVFFHTLKWGTKKKCFVLLR